MVLSRICNIPAISRGYVDTSCPSNREGLWDGLGGSGLSFLIFGKFFPASLSRPCRYPVVVPTGIAVLTCHPATIPV